MFKKLWHSFVPCEANDYRPYFLRALPVAILLAVIVGLYGGAQWAEKAITTTGSSLAAVVSAVLVDLTNTDRANNALHTLAVNPTLQAVAHMKAEDMAAKSYFAHTSPDGKTPWYWFNRADYHFAYAGENLAVYFTDSADVERAWMNSPGHRANLLSPHFTEIGIATAQGMYQGQTTTFVVQMFGAPALAVSPRSDPAATSAATSTSTSIASAGESKPATTTPAKPLALVKGETTELDETLSVIHEDPEFIAVKSESTMSAPSLYQTERQSTLFERMLASPQTSLSMAYGAIALILVLALVFLVIFEIRQQRPMHIFFAILLIALIVVLLYASESRVVVESAHAAAFFGI